MYLELQAVGKDLLVIRQIQISAVKIETRESIKL